MLWSGVMPAKFQLTLCISQHLLLSMINDTFSSLYNSVTNTNFSTPARCLQSWCILILTILTLKACARPLEQWNNVFNRVRLRVSGAIMLVTVINCNSGYQCVMSRSGCYEQVWNIKQLWSSWLNNQLYVVLNYASMLPISG